MGKGIRAGCGMEIRESEGWMCPYFSRPDEWKKEKAGYGPCGVDLTIDNTCCFADFEEHDEWNVGNFYTKEEIETERRIMT